MDFRRNGLRSGLLVLLALALSTTAIASGRPAPRQAQSISASAAPGSCTPWVFRGCCPHNQELQERACTDSTGVTVTETRCVVVGECV